MYKSIHFDGHNLLKSDDYLRGQDIVYHSPAYKGYEALPFGDGDTTYLFWNTPRQLVFHINKSDAVDFAPDGNFKAWSWESEEKNTAQVHCARITLEDSMPSFDTLYLSSFEQRLVLLNGQVHLHSETPFSKWKCSAFASFEDKVMAAKIACESSEPVERKISLEAWGSRSFFHFYEQIVNDGSKRISDTCSGQKEGAAYVVRHLAGTVVATCVKVVGADCKISIPNRHTAAIVLPKSTAENFILLSTTVTAKTEDGLLDKALSAINKASENLGRVEENNNRYWNDFWGRSFVHLQDGYLENLYNFNLYSLNCCSRGKYPVNALGGAWTWNSDARNWGHFYHWNCQQTFWGLEEANHADLAANYYDFRYAMLKNAEDDARRYFETDGAFFSDICNINGYQAVEPDTIRNLTVGPQIALDLYRHFQYAADRDFLQKKAYPFMEACLKYYIGLLKKENGVYHIDGGSAAYESYWNLKDTVTDYSMIKKLIESVLEAETILGVEDPGKSKLQEIEADLFQMPSVGCEADGKKTTVLSAGTKWDGGAVGITEGDYPWSPFPACQLSAIFPSGLIGLKDAGTEIFSKAVRTVRFILDTEFYQSGKMGCSGHTPIPQAVARLGMKSEMLNVLRVFAQKYQRFPNGFMHYLDCDAENFLEGEYRPRLLDGKENSTVWNNVHEKSDGVRINLSKDRFIQMYYEPSSNFMCGVNEMLLQSHEGVIRVFPAVPDHYTAMFQLKAQGNFLVTSEMIDGEIMYVALESMSGGRCRVQCPWKSEIRVLTGEQKQPFRLGDGQVVFETAAGNSYILERVEFPLSMYYNCEIKTDMKPEVKKLGTAVLGKERQF